MKGTYTFPDGKKIYVAVKTLKEEDIPSQKVVLHDGTVSKLFFTDKCTEAKILQMFGFFVL